VALATALATILTGWVGALEFMPCRPPLAHGFGVLRLSMDLLFPFVVLPVFGLCAFLAISAVGALIERRFRRALSMACAAAVIPLFVAARNHVALFTPYYWYLLGNEAQLEAAATSSSSPGMPVFAIFETRDVSFGMATAPRAVGRSSTTRAMKSAMNRQAGQQNGGLATRNSSGATSAVTPLKGHGRGICAATSFCSARDNASGDEHRPVGNRIRNANGWHQSSPAPLPCQSQRRSSWLALVLATPELRNLRRRLFGLANPGFGSA
jgi:hypothetical protein